MTDYASADEWKYRRAEWYAKLVFFDDAGNGSIHYISDHSGDFSSTPFSGNVEQWARGYTGLSSLVRPRYTAGRAQIRFRTDRFRDQQPDEGVFDILKNYYAGGGRLELWLNIPGVGGTKMFDGVIDNAPSGSPYDLTVDGDSENYTQSAATEPALRLNYANMRSSDEGRLLAIAAGPVGLTRDLWADGLSGALTNLSKAEFGRFGIYSATVPAPMTDRRVGELRVKPARGSSWKNNDALADEGSPTVIALWPGDTRLPVVFEGVSDSDVETDEVNIPNLVSGTSYSGNAGIEDHEVTLRKCHIPTPNPDYVTNTNDVLSDWENVFDLADVHTKATFQSKANTFKVQGAFLGQQVPKYANRAVNPTAGDGATHKVFALLLYDGGSTASNAITLTISYGSGTTQTATYNMNPGYNGIELDLTEATGSAVIRTQDWGDDATNDYIQIHIPTAASITTTDLHLLRFGMSVEWVAPIYPGTVQNPDIDDDVEAKYFVTGYATDDTDPGDVAQAAIDLALTDAPDTPSFNTATGGAFGSFDTMSTDLQTGVTDAGGSGSFQLGVSDAVGGVQQDDDLSKIGTSVQSAGDFGEAQDVIDRICDSTYSLIWRSPYTGDFNARVLSVDMDTDWETLTVDHLLRPDAFTFRYSDPASEIRNAVYVEYDWSEMRRRYRGRVYIDNSTIGSSDETGASDATLEGLADDSQGRHGRRVLTIRAPHCRDATSAWSVCWRAFMVNFHERLHLSFETEWWALGLEQCHVFTTHSSFDDKFGIPFPIPTALAQTWAGKKWLVRRVSWEPHAPFVVEAVNIDDHT